MQERNFEKLDKISFDTEILLKEIDLLSKKTIRKIINSFIKY